MRSAECGIEKPGSIADHNRPVRWSLDQFRIPHFGKTIGRHRLGRPGRPVHQERRGLLKPERNDWSLTMASAFPARGHDIGHSIWVHDRAVGSIILLPVP